MTGQSITKIILLGILVILSAYFSATETAFLSLNKTRIRTLVEKGDTRAALTLALSEKYDDLLSTILIGNNIVNITMSSVGTLLFLDLLGDIGASVSTAVITVVVLIFGEITPKSLAKESPERFAMFSAPIINTLLFILTPFNFLFSQWKKLLAGMFDLNKDTKISQEELLMMVEEVRQDGSIDHTEGELLKNAIEFGDLKAKDILTHRLDVAAVAVGDSTAEIEGVFTRSGYSRLPVYEEGIDNIVGVLDRKDFYTADGITKKDIRDIMKPPIFVVKEVKIDLVLRELQRKKAHLAVVLDEYGGTYGVITMEDILDELVGELWEDSSVEDGDIQRLSDTLYCVNAAIDLERFRDFFDIDIGSDMVSFSGWITEQLERIPNAGDHFEYEGLDIRVMAMDSHRVAEAEVRLTERYHKKDENEEKDE